METKTYIIPLNERNYATWKIQVKMNLMKEDLYGFILGTETKPSGSGGDGGLAALHRFEKRRDKCLAIIVLAIDPKLLYLVGDPTDPLIQ